MSDGNGIADNTLTLAASCLPIPERLVIGACDEAGFFRSRFAAHHGAERISEVDPGAATIVTGYGPTNAPTVGTLSAILATRQLQQRTGLAATLIVSDLGAWNSRNIEWGILEELRDRILRFLGRMGFDPGLTTLRTHQDPANLILAGRIAKLLTEADFHQNRESLDELYTGLGARGSMLGVMIDGLYTVADILRPLTDGSERVLMVAGHEEHYFADLSNIVLARARGRNPADLFPAGAAVGALFLDVVPGLGGFPKMSKSIPGSAIHLGEPEASIREKICGDARTPGLVIMRMVELASGWDSPEVNEARTAFAQRGDDPRAWADVKSAYADTLTGYARMWSASAA